MTREILIPAIENGIVKEETIDAKVRHILQTLIAFGALDTPREDKSIDKDNAQSKEIALDLAREGVVLLKNDNGTLPYRNGRTLVIGLMRYYSHRRRKRICHPLFGSVTL